MTVCDTEIVSDLREEIVTLSERLAEYRSAVGEATAEIGHLGDGPNDLRVAVERFHAAARRERSRLPAPPIEPGPRLTNADALDLLEQVGPSLDPPKP